MNRKAKGIKAERELVKFFNENDWACLRTPGSGSSRYPSPDILAANAIRRLAIECKVTKDKKKYFTDGEIKQLGVFSKKFGAESWVGVKFGAEGWYFLTLDDLDNTGNMWSVSLEIAQRRGLRKNELIGEKI